MADDRAGSLDERLAAIIRQCLAEGQTVEIDGVGRLHRLPSGEIHFVPRTRFRVFLAYVIEDLPKVEMLYRAFTAAGLDTWMDRRRLLPGQNWAACIRRAISVSDLFVACFSRRAQSRRSQFHAELRFALECSARLPLDDAFVLPVRLDECLVPRRIRNRLEYADLFPDWDAGVQRLLAAVREEARGRAKRSIRGTNPFPKSDTLTDGTE